MPHQTTFLNGIDYLPNSEICENLPRYRPSRVRAPSYHRYEDLKENRPKSINRRYKLDRDAIIRDDGRIFYFYLGNPRDAQDFSQLWNERMTIEAYKDNYLRINNESILYKMTGGFFKSKKFKFNFGGEWRWIDKGDRLVFRAIYRNECNEKEIRKIAVYEKNTREFLFDQKQLSMMLIDEFEIVMLMSCMVFMQSLEKRSLLRRRW